jgi:hypothetical protein
VGTYLTMATPACGFRMSANTADKAINNASAMHWHRSCYLPFADVAKGNAATDIFFSIVVSQRIG